MRLVVPHSLLTVIASVLLGCAYYNGLYNANQLANEARRADPEIVYEIELPITSTPGLGTTIMMPLAVETDHPLVETVVGNVRSVAGIEPNVGAVRPFSYAGNDTAHLYAAGIPCLLYGPGGGQTEDGTVRWTSVKQLLDCTRVLGASIADLCA